MMLRARRFAPPPQLCEQAPHTPQELTSQCTAQCAVPHTLVSEKPGHATPAYAGCVRMRRSRTLKPPPHVLEQSDQAPKLDTTQSMGHGAVLHAWSSSRCLQTSPPWTGCVTTLRARCCVPLPHVAVHGDHAVNELTSQWMGHGLELQSLCSEESPQGAPPKEASLMSRRMRISVPPPHVCEQLPQPPQGE